MRVRGLKIRLGPAALAGLLPLLGAASARAQSPVPVAVERRLAAELGLRVGDSIRLGVSTDSLVHRGIVAAVYEPAPDPATVTRQEFHIQLHLPDLERVLGADDRVDRFGVAVQSGVVPDSAAAALNRVAFGYEARTSRSIATRSSRTFLVVSRFHRAIAVISVVASAVFLLCIMLLKVEERRKDAAVMRLIGVRVWTVFGALALEATLIAILGSIIGIGIAQGAGALTNLYYEHLFQTRLVFSAITPGIILFSVLLSIGLGLAAGSIAAWRLVRTPPLALWSR